MWKLVIADDEPKIRRGLKNILDWKSYDIDVVGEAEDGELALEVVNEKHPDIILLDINMPFLNGLNLLEKLRNTGFNGVVIIISGYDDFSYARKALKLNVYDYILKPVNKENLEKVISEVILKLKENTQRDNYKKWIEKQIDKNIYELKRNFFSEWLDNKLTYEDVLKQMKYFKINLDNNLGILVIKLIDKLNVEVMDKKWDADLIKYAIFNMLNDDFEDYDNKFIFEDSRKNIVLIASVSNFEQWINKGKEIQLEIANYIKCNVLIEQSDVKKGILEIKDAYHQIIDKFSEKKQFSPMVLYVIKYIEDNYYLNELSINDISNKLEVTSSYLSKLLKKETGLSFIDYLTDVRIKKAKYLMNDPSIRIYDVSELVGYSNQHYFCRAFKKVTGISPTEYKRGL